MKEKEARRREKYFDGGVKAGVWCYTDDGQWAISINFSEGSITLYGLDDVKRLFNGMRQALDYVQQNSQEPGWREIPNANTILEQTE